MDFKTEAIVLNKIKYSDSTYIVNLYTRQEGKMAVLSRVPKSKKNSIKPNTFLPFNIVEIEIKQKYSRNIQTIKNCNTLVPLYNIYGDVYRSSIAQFICEIVSKSVKDNEPDNKLYEYLKTTILKLNDVEVSYKNIHLIFMKDYADILGFRITNNFSEKTPYFNLKEGMFLPVFTVEEESVNINLSKTISTLLLLDFNSLNDFNISYQNRKEILKILISYLKTHLTDLPEIKTIDVLNSVFAD